MSIDHFPACILHSPTTGARALPLSECEVMPTGNGGLVLSLGAGDCCLSFSDLVTTHRCLSLGIFSLLPFRPGNAVESAAYKPRTRQRGRQPLSFAPASSYAEEVRPGDEGQLPFTPSSVPFGLPARLSAPTKLHVEDLSCCAQQSTGAYPPQVLDGARQPPSSRLTDCGAEFVIIKSLCSLT